MPNCPKCGYNIPARTSAQNRKLWPMLADISRQVLWPVDGVLDRLSKEDWKDIFTVALRQHQREVEGINGGSVFLGSHTSQMSRQEISMLIELMYAFGAEHCVIWSEPSLQAYSQYREAH